MNQQLRIFLYFICIMGGAAILSRTFPFPYQPGNWTLNLPREEENIEVDSALVLQTIEVDTLEIPIDPVPKDTVITKDHLSCPTLFINQLQDLHQELLNSTKDNRNIRILHYGDSQIEGDRITAYIRETFQNRFGGCGPGLTTVYDPQRINPSVWLDSKGDWKIHSVFNRKYRLSNKAYGLMGQTASLEANSPGAFKISASRWAEKHASHYQKVRLFIAPHTDTLIIKGKIKSTEVINDSLAPSANLTEISWEFEQLSPILQFDLSSKAKVHILACALDSISGISVDNIALRGQSTPMLHLTDGQLFTAMGEHLDIGMIIFQFGTNVIPTVAPNYHFYKVQLSKQFDLLKKYLPGIPVIVVGVADAARFSDGQLQSYEHLSRIRDAQKAIALDYNFAFFDLYEAMGGNGSIIKWTESDPPLALTDYIHFTRLGGKKAAAYLTNAIWQHFNSPSETDTCLFTQKPAPWESY
ncbi:GDSL-type esterase/lipase family protein [Carboxylicivirga sp. RSCT41]|uniref:GDSL-type esterase/lipase family protein n=1 Tax=Carboxylicivirga agarovorans TaxID=3417570 RepID=UPI003D343DF6